MKRKWVKRPGAPGDIEIDLLQKAFREGSKLEGGSEFKLDKFRAALLASRGVRSYEQARQYLNPGTDHTFNPFLMRDMERSAKRIIEAIENREQILVYGDYDVDGTTSVALMYLFLRRFTPNVGYYIPDRFQEGYGISFKGVEYASHRRVGLFIALDCGTRAFEEIRYARSKGMDVIICDHHTPGDHEPPAFALLNPKRTGCGYPFKELPGCGIGYKLAQALAEKMLYSYKLPNQYLDLVVTSIASDIVPMVGENRWLARLGLQKLEIRPSTGMKALKEVSGIGDGPLDIQDIVYKIGPRLNAAGRMKSAFLSLALLTAKEEGKARQIAGEINETNLTRRELDAKITAEALEQAEKSGVAGRNSLVLHDPHWHKGIIGIVASRVVEQFYRPVVILSGSGDMLTGSARSIPGFDLYSALVECKHHFSTFGGHKAAAGMSLHRKNLEQFRSDFEAAVAKNITSELLTPKIEYDLEVPPEALSPAFCKIMERMGPFGPENTRPVLVSFNIKPASQSRIVGDNHLKMFIQNGKKKFSAIGFKLGNYLEDIHKGKPIDICYSLEKQWYKGNPRYELHLKDLNVKS